MSHEENERPILPTQSLARRFGGHFLGLLRPHQEVAKTAVEREVDQANEIIDQRQHAHFHVNLFREIRPATPINLERLGVLKQQFEAELASRHTIADRFSLFADEFYAPYVNTLDLGETKRPGSHEEVAAIKEEYHVLLKTLIDANLIDGELPRGRAKRSIHFSQSKDSPYVTAERNRELFDIVDGNRELSVAKRMTFLMPHSAAETLYIPPRGSLNAREVKKIEALIDAQDGTAIIPVRTVYYAKSKPLDK